MRTRRLLTTGLLVLSLSACKDKQAETPPPTATPPAAPASTGTQAAQEVKTRTEPAGPEAPPSATPNEHAASPAPRSRPPAERPGPWQKKALAGADLYAILQTSKGDIVVKFFSKQSPVTVANFVGLATGEQAWKDPRSGQLVKAGTPLYNNVLFHRVIPGFMIQGGDPLGQGTGSPGYEFENETQNGLRFDKVGLMAMANHGPDTNGSQFFITDSIPDNLTGGYTIFGEVLKGYDAVERISHVPRGEKGRDRPNEDVVLKHVVVSDTRPQ